jgi:hypothetical protein
VVCHDLHAGRGPVGLAHQDGIRAIQAGAGHEANKMALSCHGVCMLW